MDGVRDHGSMDYLRRANHIIPIIMDKSKSREIEATVNSSPGDGPRADNCARCGACLSFCPVYQSRPIERYSPRGKNYLLRSNGMKKRQKLIRQTVTACLQCGACTSLCSSGTDVASLIRRTRQEVPYFQSLPHSLFGAWERLGQVKGLKAVSFLERLSPVLKDFTGRINMSERPFLENLDFYARAYRGSMAVSSPFNGNGRLRVLFFAGCVQNFMYPGTASKIAALFDWDLYIPESQTCCGLPAYSQGAMKQARKLAVKNLNVFARDRFDVILTGCASCAYMIRNWPLLFDGDREYLHAARNASEQVMELSEFVAGHDFSAVKKGGRPVLLQVPCHQRYGLDSGDSPMTAMKKIAGGRIKVLNEALGCCGLGGTFSILNPELSKTIFEQNIKQRISSINLNNGAAVVTTCSGCLHRLKQGLGDSEVEDGPVADVLHLVDIMVDDTDV